jgi:hypothetical protein
MTPVFVLFPQQRNRTMKLKTIVLATAFAMTSSLVFAQAPIGSSADSGNGAVINRGPVTTVGEDLDFRTNRSWAPRHAHPRHARFVKRRHQHVAERH